LLVFLRVLRALRGQSLFAFLETHGK
jgi:hypothetical protein